MTVEQRRDGTPAYEWQLLVGCDPRERTYTVRLGRDDEHQVAYDRFGYPDPVQWFCVLVIGDERPTERRAVEIESIRHAVDMARARDAANESLPSPLDARGLAACDLWRTILEDEADTTAADRARAEFLSRSRDLAARYLADLGDRHAEVPALKRAAEAYAAEAREAAMLSVLLADVPIARPGDRRRIVEVFDAVAASEREAVGHLEGALASLAA